MLEKLFGKKDESPTRPKQAATDPVSRPAGPASSEPARELGERPVDTPPASPASPYSSLTLAKGAQKAEERARAAIAAVAAAATSAPAKPVIALPEAAGVREQAAAYFSSGEHKRAVDLLVGHLNKTAGNTPKSIWFMLMDAYQALGQQAAFEKSAWLFANFFKTSPPSWENAPAAPSSAPSPSPVMGRNVLVMEGLPSQAHPEKLKDFVTFSRQAHHARLDLSRTRLDEDHAQRSDDLKVLLGLMRRLRRHHVPTLLMGENQLVGVIRTVIQQDLPVPQADLYWELLLEFMQWRGQEEAYEDLAISFAERFSRSAPGYEFTGVIALAPDDQPSPKASASIQVMNPPSRMDEPEMEAWCEQLEIEFSSSPPSLDNPVRLDFHGVQVVGFSAAGILASRLKQWELPAESMVFAGVNELVSALFDITGVSGQVLIQPRKR